MNFSVRFQEQIARTRRITEASSVDACQMSGSDVCLEAEVSPRGSLEAAKVMHRLDVLIPRLGLASVLMLWPRPHLFRYRLFCLSSTRGIETSKFTLRYNNL